MTVFHYVKEQNLWNDNTTGRGDEASTRGMSLDLVPSRRREGVRAKVDGTGVGVSVYTPHETCCESVVLECFSRACTDAEPHRRTCTAVGPCTLLRSAIAQCWGRDIEPDIEPAPPAGIAVDESEDTGGRREAGARAWQPCDARTGSHRKSPRTIGTVDEEEGNVAAKVAGECKKEGRAPKSACLCLGGHGFTLRLAAGGADGIDSIM
ncbi:hypothetical protein B0H10DRAFT_2028976 [Mycena sp. CBHHK59/15]|nr:hypothetical protein B0H10DRAFT_2028976 [Mycena sp. CBHHK59/15]